MEVNGELQDIHESAERVGTLLVEQDVVNAIRDLIDFPDPQVEELKAQARKLQELLGAVAGPLDDALYPDPEPEEFPEKPRKRVDNRLPLC